MTATSSSELIGPLGAHDHIAVLPALRLVNAHLLELLESLAAAEWKLPTIHATRAVKDLVAHLVDGSMRRLSLQRDGWAGTPPTGIDSFQSLVEFIQTMNRQWMATAQRLSPRILIDLARRYDTELLELLASLDPTGAAIFSVAWAGEEQSLNWFDVAREYTEKWHHQQQLRDATHRAPLYDPALLGPVLDTFARGFPHALRTIPTQVGTSISVRIVGPVTRSWTLRRTADNWLLYSGLDSQAAAALTLDADRAWRLWTKGLSPEQIHTAATCEGDTQLVEPLLGFTAIMA